ncbi:hypothetical protein HPB47_022784 [Ixodes persulcatus]|uniref:Uncharacterized protein n=1 Tax=Ixodes persulcatus TaxID=34615 RepID=A0AC60Q980_IXOPE|nr:hypothetical protein HPB47_022784 [Ixodes persulcatus]
MAPERFANAPFGGKLSLESDYGERRTRQPSRQPGHEKAVEASSNQAGGGRGAWHPGNHGRSDEHASCTVKGGLRTK